MGVLSLTFSLALLHVHVCGCQGRCVDVCVGAHKLCVAQLAQVDDGSLIFIIGNRAGGDSRDRADVTTRQSPLLLIVRTSVPCMCIPHPMHLPSPSQPQRKTWKCAGYKCFYSTMNSSDLPHVGESNHSPGT